MKKPLDLIKSELELLFSSDDPEITVTENSKRLGVAVVSQMYEYIEVQFSTMMSLRAIFNGEFNIDKWSSTGCETCDYGSQYTMEFEFERPDTYQGVPNDN